MPSGGATLTSVATDEKLGERRRRFTASGHATAAVTFSATGQRRRDLDAINGGNNQATVT